MIIVKKDFLKIGTAYHTIMQHLTFNENREEIQELINTHVSNDLIKDISVEEVFIAKENLKDLVLNAKQVFKEKQFVMRENYNKLVKNSDNNTKVIIQGIIDLIVVSDGGTYLIDYKTNRTNNEKQLIEDYSLQLDIYKRAFEKATNITIDKKFLYSFYMKKLIEVNWKKFRNVH